ncbi:MAG: hypothetical protein OHK0026_13020 [Rhodocyclaceae bacterium]
MIPGHRTMLLAALLAASAQAFASFSTLVASGPASNRVDIAFLGDGYTAGDLAAGLYANDVLSYVSAMFAPGLNQDPFHRYRNYFNVYRVALVSAQSGADVPPLGIYRDTALDASYYGDGATERLLNVDAAKAEAAMNSAFAGSGIAPEMRFVAVNDSRYGGSGGAYTVYAGGNSSSHEIALHELGHSFSGLADEYGGLPGAYDGGEPAEVNVTTDPGGAKWSRWLGHDQPGIGTIGAYAGAAYFDSGIYRPSPNSKMRSLGQPFDAVAREKIILDIYALTDPLDGWLDTSSLLPASTTLWVDEIDPDVIDVQWYVDGSLVAGASANRFRLADFGYGPGVHSVAARAFDPTGFDPVSGWVRADASALEQTVTWTVQVVPEPENVLLLLAGLALLGARLRRDHRVCAALRRAQASPAK